MAEVGGLPIGSLYYYFPGGKEQLGVAAVSHGATQFAGLLREGLSVSNDPEEALSACASLLADRLEATRWRLGCPVATVALESVNRSVPLRDAAASALQSWVDLVAARLVELGLDATSAAEIACLAISVLELAELMARVQGSRQPLDVAAARLPSLVRGPG